MSQVTSAATPASPSLGEILDGINGVSTMNDAISVLRPADITLNSVAVTQSGLFVAIPGAETDGRAYVNEAIEKGALSVLYEADQAPERCSELAAAGRAVAIENLAMQLSEIASRFFGNPTLGLRVVGITGTNGKTTCAFLLSQAMNLLGERCAMMGTIGTGLMDQLVETDLTTKDAVETQRTLRQLVDQGATAVCMEVSSHGLEQHRVDAVNFDVAVFTNLSQDHLDYHGTMDTYASAKKRLFRFSCLRAIAVNSDDTVGKQILQQLSPCHKITYGRETADILPSNLKIDARGISFNVQWQGQSHLFVSKLSGEINLPNLLATIATLLVLDYPIDDIARVFPQLDPPPGRMEGFAGKENQPLVVVDYAHTPDSLQRALQSLRQQCEGSLSVVFGCGGDRDQGKRSLMGRAAASYADHVILTNDNPRTEDPLTIVKHAVEGIQSVKKTTHFEIILDRRKAIETAIASASAGDIVLVAGKGHERTQTQGRKKIAFSDRDVVSQILGGDA